MLDIVDRKRIAGAQHIDVAPLNQFLQILRRAGVDDCGPCDEQDFSARSAHAFELTRGFADDRALGLFDGDVGGDELECVGA